MALYNKYDIAKHDGTPVDPNAQYFVLRIDTDPVARHALFEYASGLPHEDKALALEILRWLTDIDPDYHPRRWYQRIIWWLHHLWIPNRQLVKNAIFWRDIAQEREVELKLLVSQTHQKMVEGILHAHNHNACETPASPGNRPPSR